MKMPLLSLLTILRDQPLPITHGGDISKIQFLKRLVHTDIFQGRLRFQTEGATAVVDDSGLFDIRLPDAGSHFAQRSSRT